MSTLPHNPTFNDLIETIATLRSEHGCPWDKEQTISTLKPYLLEETQEVLEAIENIEKQTTPETILHHCEELGDLLLQILLQSRIQEENGYFSIHDVIKTLQEKLIRRHPHVFSEHKDSLDKSPQAIAERWAKIKQEEKEAQKFKLLGNVRTN